MDLQKLKDFGALIQRLIEKKNLTESETYSMFREIMLNVQPDLQQGAALAALTAKGETIEEIVGAWRAIYDIDTVHATEDLPGPLFENSGTGMDALKTFNVSSAAAIVAAACGVVMARHGARAITSVCGTVDIMESLGVDVECSVKTIEKSIRNAGIGLFNGTSSKVHPVALGRVLSQIRFGSILNIAASLAHPCPPALGLRGVYSGAILERTAAAMKAVGYRRGMVVYGEDGPSGKGMDEISTTGKTLFIEFTEGGDQSGVIAPEDVGIKRGNTNDIISTGSLETETFRFLRVLANRGHESCIDFTCLNAGAILYTAGLCDTLKKGVEKGREVIGNGSALAKLREWVTSQDERDGKGIARLENLIKACL